jgi:hypothetical protein
VIAADLVVLGERGELELLAPALAVALAAQCAERAALVITLLADGAPRRRWAAPASAAAARFRDRLTDQGVVAGARGRLVTTECSGEGAVATAERLIATAQLPVVIVALRPRDEQLDALISAARRVVVARSGDAELERLAIAQIAALGVEAELLDPPPSAAARFAAAGLNWGRLARSDGQASVELLAAAPILLAVTLAAAQLLAAGLCRELAGDAAGAGAAALLQSRDPQAAARRALPGWSRSHLRVTRRGRELRVVINPPSLVPGLARLLSVEARANAGPPA